MLLTKRKEVTKQGFCKRLRRKLRLRRSLLLVPIQFRFQSHCHSSGWSGDGRLFEFDWEGEGVRVGWALFRGWALINFSCL